MLREVYQFFRVGQAPKAYPYFEIMLKEFDRDDMVMFELVATDGLWQFEAPIKSWRLYKSCRVHCLIMEGMIIYMLDDVEYPLPKTTLQKMLDHKCKANKIFPENAFDVVIHFAAVAYVGESTLDPLKYYHNITSNTLGIMEAMATHNVNKLIYSNTCATYREPEKMPITEVTPQIPINPYGKAKKMAEDIILDFHKNSYIGVMILRYFNVIGSDPEGRLGEAPKPELCEHGRISGACFDAARGIADGLKVRGTDYKAPDGTCIRDYIDVTDLVDAHVKALAKATPGHVGIYNVGTGR
ncbi:UDP-arabinose 4-epimerase 1-like protein, partial [Tanacetum coccineum]